MTEISERHIEIYQREYLATLRFSQTAAEQVTESPIEASLLVGMSHLVAIGEAAFRIKILNKDTDRRNLPQHYFSRGALIVPQEPIGPYRADFLVMIRGWSEQGNLDRSIVVECDGHQWHDRTSELAARDKARDRYFAERGILVMRFTGSEIWRDPAACARQIDSAVKNTITDWQVEGLRLSAPETRPGGNDVG